MAKASKPKVAAPATTDTFTPEHLADQTPSVNKAPAPVTLQGKTVEARPIDGKVRLRKMVGARPTIITGFIPMHLAKQVMAGNPNLEIVNENLEPNE